jgi:DNA-binding NarL/FixJ family response regulator
MKNFPLTPDIALHVIVAGPVAARNACLAELILPPDSVGVVDTNEYPRHVLLLAEWERPDAVLLDLDIPFRALSQIISNLNESAPPPAIIVLAYNKSPLLRKRCLELGASHVFDITADWGEVFTTLHAIRDRKTQTPRLKQRSPLSAPVVMRSDAAAVVRDSTTPAEPCRI